MISKISPEIAQKIVDYKLQAKYNNKRLATAICLEHPEFVDSIFGKNAHIHYVDNEVLGNDLCRMAEYTLHLLIGALA